MDITELVQEASYDIVSLHRLVLHPRNPDGKVKIGALAWFACDIDAARHKLYQLQTDRQAKASATVFAAR